MASEAAYKDNAEEDVMETSNTSWTNDGKKS